MLDTPQIITTLVGNFKGQYSFWNDVCKTHFTNKCEAVTSNKQSFFIQNTHENISIENSEFQNLMKHTSVFIYFDPATAEENLIEKHRAPKSIALNYASLCLSPLECLKIIPGLISEYEKNAKENLSKLPIILRGLNDPGCVFSQVPKDVVQVLSCTFFSVSQRSQIITNIPKQLITLLEENENHLLKK